MYLATDNCFMVGLMKSYIFFKVLYEDYNKYNWKATSEVQACFKKVKFLLCFFRPKKEINNFTKLIKDGI